jgi:hypothetical protein
LYRKKKVILNQETSYNKYDTASATASVQDNINKDPANFSGWTQAQLDAYIAGQVDILTKAYPFNLHYENNSALKMGIMPILGMQIMPMNKLSIGLKAGIETIFSQKEERHYTEKKATAGQNDSSEDLLIMGNYTTKISDPQYTLDFSLGIAFFVSKNIVISADLKYFPQKSVKGLAIDLSKDHSGYVNNDLNVKEPYYFVSTYTFEDVINGAIGVEYFVTPNFPIRMGAFTNFSNQPKATDTNRGQHIDFFGGTLGLAWQTANSSIALTGMAQYGTGKSFQYDGIKDVTSIAYSFSLTGSSKY